MLGLFTPILALQAFCIYHAYRNNSEQRWYWLILFFPLVGCIIYLMQNFNNRTALNDISETVKGVVINNYRIEQLEKALRFSDTIRNKINLGDEYVKVGRHQDAIALYDSCLQGFMNDDPSVRMKLLNAHFMNADYAATVEIGNKLDSEKTFRNAEERVVYAWSLHQVQETAKATQIFEDMDRSFTNYHHRKEYCKFLIATGKIEIAREKLQDLVQEFDHLKGAERRQNRSVFREINDMRSTVVKA